MERHSSLIFVRLYFLHLFSCTPESRRREGFSNAAQTRYALIEALIMARGLSFAVTVLRSPVAPTAACTTAFLSVALEHQTKYPVAQRGLIGLHKLWLCRNFDVL